MRRDKRIYIVALRQAKIYPPGQAAAAADRGKIEKNEKLKRERKRAKFEGSVAAI